MGWLPIFAVDSLAVSLTVGTVLGFLSGLGIGGGSLLLLWLTMALGMPQETARSINLLFFLPAAAASCFFRKRQGVLNIRKALPAMVAGCAGAVLGTWLEGFWDTELLKKTFGILLLVTGIRELLRKAKKKAP